MAATVDPLDRPADRATIESLYRAGCLSAMARRAALRRLRPPLAWWRWASRMLLCLGAALLLAGIVFFFAYNWARMGKTLKFGLVEAALVACVGGAWLKGLERLSGKILLLGACVLVGALLGVYGQIYQTGADPWELFIGWAALILGWVVIARFAALWLLWLVILNIGIALLWEQVLVPNDLAGYDENTLALAAINGLALVGREIGAARGWDWLSGRWLRWVLLAGTLVLLSTPPVVLISEPHDEVVIRAVGTALWLGGIALGYAYYRTRGRDLLALTMIAASVCVVALTLIGKLLFELTDEAVVFLLFGLIILGVVTAAALWLHRVGKALQASRDDAAAMPDAECQMPDARNLTQGEPREGEAPAEPREGEAPAEPPSASCGRPSCGGAVRGSAGLARAKSRAASPSHDASGAAHSLAGAKEAASGDTDGRPVAPFTVRALSELVHEIDPFPRWDEDVARRVAAEAGQPPGFPWFVRLLIGIGAWVAAGFLLGFLGAAGLIDDNDVSLLVWGLVWIGLSVGLHRWTQHAFFEQLALALSVAGHGMTLFYVGLTFDSGRAVAATMLLLCVALYRLNRDPGHRLLSVVATAAAAVGWLLHEGFYEAIHVVVLIEAVGLSIVFTSGRIPSAARPLGFGLAVALPLTLLLTPSAWDLDIAWWRSSLALTLWLLWLVRWCGHEHAKAWNEPLTLAVLVVLALGAVSTPGLLAAIGLVALGYALGERLLAGIGLLFVPVFVITFYYDLELALDIKSYMLMATGVVLLGTRWLLGRRPWAQEEPT